MATAIALSDLPDSALVPVLNPAPGGRPFVTAKRARRFVRDGKHAHMDSAGHLVFHGGGWGAALLVACYSGCDAFPKRAVLPPSGEVLARMGTHGRVLAVAAVSEA